MCAIRPPARASGRTPSRCTARRGTAATGATTLRRGRISDVTFGVDAAPADYEVSFKLDRQTTVGTATAVVPAPLDPGDAAALLVANVNNTIEPTVTAEQQQSARDQLARLGLVGSRR